MREPGGICAGVNEYRRVLSYHCYTRIVLQLLHVSTYGFYRLLGRISNDKDLSRYGCGTQTSDKGHYYFYRLIGYMFRMYTIVSKNHLLVLLPIMVASDIYVEMIVWTIMKSDRDSFSDIIVDDLCHVGTTVWEVFRQVLVRWWETWDMLKKHHRQQSLEFIWHKWYNKVNSQSLFILRIKELFQS